METRIRKVNPKLGDIIVVVFFLVIDFERFTRKMHE